MLLFALALFLLPGPNPIPGGSPPPALQAVFHRGQSVAIVAFDMSSAQPRYWHPDLEIAQRATSEFQKMGLFRVVPRIAGADYVFEIVLDQSSPDDAEAGAVVRTADFGSGGLDLAQLRTRSVWFGLSRPHRPWGFFRPRGRRAEGGGEGRIGVAAHADDGSGSALHFWAHSSARDLVRQFCKATGLTSRH